MVRYVDKDQAVIEIRIDLKTPPEANASPEAWLKSIKSAHHVEALIEVDSEDGFHDEQRVRVNPLTCDAIRVEVVQPSRWWPAGLGDQSLYLLSVTLLVDDTVTDSWSHNIGLTSVRKQSNNGVAIPGDLLINGKMHHIGEIIPVDAIDEDEFLPVSGDSLVLIRGHYGPDLLYEAADRAGILLVQAVPIHPHGQPESDMAAEVERLSLHPSLAGWFVGHLGYMTERIAYCLTSLDPSRGVFRSIPGVSAA